MSERASPITAGGEPVTLETGLEALQSSPEFNGPVESLDGHDCNNHFAHIYETSEEKFTSAVPFVRHGLEGDERVMYVVDESSEAEVKTALHDGGVDIDAALDTGQLSFHTVQDTYLRNGSFDPDEMIDFYDDTVTEATAEYEALRIVAETTWLRDDATTVEQFMEYESKVNDLFAGEDCLALCQYDRNGFPPEIVRNIVQTHPHLIYDGVACHNFYYTPPEEFFGPDEPTRENERMLRTLRDRTVAKTELQRRERFLEDLHETTSATDRGFDEKLQAVFELGCEWFDLDLGGLAKVDPDSDRWEVEAVSADHGHLVPGAQVDLSETYCRVTVASDGGGAVAEPVEITDPIDSGFENAACFTEFGVQAYLGTRIPVDGGHDRTFFFVAEESRDDPITDEERTFHRLMAQWVGYELQHRKREQFLRGGYEITSDPALSFEEKLQSLFELGCEQFGLELGAMATVDPDDDLFEVEYVSDDHEHFEPDLALPLSETYCTAATDAGGVGSVNDPVEAGYDDSYVHDEFGIKAYLGTYIEVEGDLNRTFFFVSENPRDKAFSDDERTFQRLLGQWVKYELERQQRERFLRESYQITSNPDLSFETKLEQLLELGRERFDLEMAGLNHLPSWDGPFRLEQGLGLGVDGDEELWTDPGYGRFCRQTIEQEEPVSMPDVTGTDWVEDTIHREFGLTSYLGTKVTSGATPYGTLWFGSTEQRDRPFSDTERTFIELMGQWVSYEIERREHNEDKRELYEVTADTELGTDEKIAELLELGCERLDLPVGMLTRNHGEEFEIEQMHGTHPDLGEGTRTPPMTDNYCRQVVDTGDPISVADAEAAGWDGDALYHEFGLECYAGVQLTVGDEPYGTICFTDLSPRDVEFTEAEQTFLDLMGQCVSYELERNHREDQLQGKNNRLESFASLLAHELRNPVTIGQIYSQQLPAETDVEAVEYVTEAFDRIENMVDVMLVLTRGREAVDTCTPVELVGAARGAWDELDAPDATLEVTVDHTIHADETYVRHLFRNLLENAVEHGGRDVTVTVGDLPDGFYVADDGVGIPADERDAVFDEGYTTAAENGGTGLGLAFVQELAEVYEWDCAVTESAAGGARFEFRNVT
ncbi:MEDS domain-containing protein [Halorussus salinisoli]|uniref:MEDS domain-containing protein n=1 Tax=Halorussus salinisoli TaxID=2558242 RepID=UPI0010C1E405|nr:MEDS domain-containing protein [Halorussus salinisoli]